MDLVEEAKNGNAQAFNSLIEMNKLKLYKTAKAILKNEDDVCDAIQETLMSAYMNISKLKENKFFSTWIVRIMVNKCYDIINKNKKSSNNYDIDEYIDDNNLKSYDTYSSDSIVEYAINKLDEDLKTITVLYYYNEFSVKEISEIIEIPEGTVKSRLSRAREKLYVILNEGRG